MVVKDTPSSLSDGYQPVFPVSRVKSKCVAEVYLEEDQSWNLTLPRRMNQVVRNEIDELQNCLTEVFLNKEADDVVGWSLEKKSRFTVKSTYDSLTQDYVDQDSSYVFKYIWGHKFPPKISFFIWTIAHNSLSIRDMLTKKRMEVPQNFLFCSQVEITNNLYLHCDFAVKIWDHFKEKSQWQFTMPDNIISMLFSWNINISDKQQFYILSMIFVAILSCIWKE
ncbi:uncharacterized protein LOC113359318 [Papaver somniferum]|uniref:uncharacterized protein LOC113359318 n=1 Tax=Papaver somniferum TaxID=3469 RepID=UPI000E6F8171|nr:uncharacterized protein LOC113359318 [Papaver somniferum]